MVQPNAAAPHRRVGRSASISLRRLNRFDPRSTEGSKENLNRRQQRKQRRTGLGFRDGHPLGAFGVSSNSRSKWFSQMRRLASACRRNRAPKFVP